MESPGRASPTLKVGADGHVAMNIIVSDADQVPPSPAPAAPADAELDEYAEDAAEPPAADDYTAAYAAPAAADAPAPEAATEAAPAPAASDEAAAAPAEAAVAPAQAAAAPAEAAAAPAEAAAAPAEATAAPAEAAAPSAADDVAAEADDAPEAPEVEARAASTFALLDANSNGSLELPELAKGVRTVASDGGVALMAAIDLDRDGSVQVDEWQRHFRKLAHKEGTDQALRLLDKLDEAGKAIVALGISANADGSVKLSFGVAPDVAAAAPTETVAAPAEADAAPAENAAADENAAATKMQSAQRGKKARNDVKQKKAEGKHKAESAAATKVQSVQRGKNARADIKLRMSHDGQVKIGISVQDDTAADAEVAALASSEPTPAAPAAVPPHSPVTVGVGVKGDGKPAITISVQDDTAEAHKAATKVQSMQRGKEARKATNTLKFNVGADGQVKLNIDVVAPMITEAPAPAAAPAKGPTAAKAKSKALSDKEDKAAAKAKALAAAAAAPKPPKSEVPKAKPGRPAGRVGSAPKSDSLVDAQDKAAAKAKALSAAAAAAPKASTPKAAPSAAPAAAKAAAPAAAKAAAPEAKSAKPSVPKAQVPRPPAAAAPKASTPRAAPSQAAPPLPQRPHEGLITNLYPDEVEMYASRHMPPANNEARQLQAERARLQRGVDPLLTPLLDERLLLHDEMDAEAPGAAQRVQMLTEGVPPRHAKAQKGYARVPRPPDGGYVAYTSGGLSYEEQMRLDRREAMRQRDAEMAALEARLALVYADGGGASHYDHQHVSMEDADGSSLIPDIDAEAVSSVVQHLSAFGLNRNLPWQLYATRHKRFERPAPTENATYGANPAVDANGIEPSRGVTLSDSPPLPPAYSNNSAYGPIDGGDSAIHPRRYTGSTYYSRSKLPRQMRMHMRPEGAMLPHIRGAERFDYGPGAPKAAWGSPRSGQHAVHAARLMSPRVLYAAGSYY